MSVAHDLLTGKIAQIDTDIDCPLVTKDNVEEFIKIHKKSGAIK
jgi:inositol transport system substrate-binding protein